MEIFHFQIVSDRSNDFRHINLLLVPEVRCRLRRDNRERSEKYPHRFAVKILCPDLIVISRAQRQVVLNPYSGVSRTIVRDQVGREVCVAGTLDDEAGFVGGIIHPT